MLSDAFLPVDAGISADILREARNKRVAERGRSLLLLPMLVGSITEKGITTQRVGELLGRLAMATTDIGKLSSFVSAMARQDHIAVDTASNMLGYLNNVGDDRLIQMFIDGVLRQAQKALTAGEGDRALGLYRVIVSNYINVAGELNNYDLTREDAGIIISSTSIVPALSAAVDIMVKGNNGAGVAYLLAGTIGANNGLARYLMLDMAGAVLTSFEKASAYGVRSMDEIGAMADIVFLNGTIKPYVDPYHWMETFDMNAYNIAIREKVDDLVARRSYLEADILEAAGIPAELDIFVNDAFRQMEIATDGDANITALRNNTAAREALRQAIARDVVTQNMSWTDLEAGEKLRISTKALADAGLLQERSTIAVLNAMADFNKAMEKLTHTNPSVETVVSGNHAKAVVMRGGDVVYKFLDDNADAAGYGSGTALARDTDDISFRTVEVLSTNSDDGRKIIEELGIPVPVKERYIVIQRRATMTLGDYLATVKNEPRKLESAFRMMTGFLAALAERGGKFDDHSFVAANMGVHLDNEGDLRWIGIIDRNSVTELDSDPQSNDQILSPGSFAKHYTRRTILPQLRERGIVPELNSPEGQIWISFVTHLSPDDVSVYPSRPDHLIEKTGIYKEVPTLGNWWGSLSGAERLAIMAAAGGAVLYAAAALFGFVPVPELLSGSIDSAVNMSMAASPFVVAGVTGEPEDKGWKPKRNDPVAWLETQKGPDGKVTEELSLGRYEKEEAGGIAVVYTHERKGAPTRVKMSEIHEYPINSLVVEKEYDILGYQDDPFVFKGLDGSNPVFVTATGRPFAISRNNHHLIRSNELSEQVKESISVKKAERLVSKQQEIGSEEKEEMISLRRPSTKKPAVPATKAVPPPIPGIDKKLPVPGDVVVWNDRGRLKTGRFRGIHPNDEKIGIVQTGPGEVVSVPLGELTRKEGPPKRAVPPPLPRRAFGVMPLIAAAGIAENGFSGIGLENFTSFGWATLFITMFVATIYTGNRLFEQFSSEKTVTPGTSDKFDIVFDDSEPEILARIKIGDQDKPGVEYEAKKLIRELVQTEQGVLSETGRISEMRKLAENRAAEAGLDFAREMAAARMAVKTRDAIRASEDGEKVLDMISSEDIEKAAEMQADAFLGTIRDDIVYVFDIDGRTEMFAVDPALRTDPALGIEDLSAYKGRNLAKFMADELHISSDEANRYGGAYEAGGAFIRGEDGSTYLRPSTKAVTVIRDGRIERVGEAHIVNSPDDAVFLYHTHPHISGEGEYESFAADMLAIVERSMVYKNGKYIPMVVFEMDTERTEDIADGSGTIEVKRISAVKEGERDGFMIESLDSEGEFELSSPLLALTPGVFDLESTKTKIMEIAKAVKPGEAVSVDVGAGKTSVTYLGEGAPGEKVYEIQRLTSYKDTADRSVSALERKITDTDKFREIAESILSPPKRLTGVTKSPAIATGMLVPTPTVFTATPAGRFLSAFQVSTGIPVKNIVELLIKAFNVVAAARGYKETRKLLSVAEGKSAADAMAGLMSLLEQGQVFTSPLFVAVDARNGQLDSKTLIKGLVSQAKNIEFVQLVVVVDRAGAVPEELSGHAHIEVRPDESIIAAMNRGIRDRASDLGLDPAKINRTHVAMAITHNEIEGIGDTYGRTDTIDTPNFLVVNKETITADMQEEVDVTVPTLNLMSILVRLASQETPTLVAIGFNDDKFMSGLAAFRIIRISPINIGEKIAEFINAIMEVATSL
ncbi:MAG: hypothetical protein WCV56_08860 [Candidatus Omnitrophota bacterium]